MTKFLNNEEGKKYLFIELIVNCISTFIPLVYNGGRVMADKKIIDIEERIPTLKEKRRQRANRRLIFYVSFFFFLILIIVYLESSYSDVKYVNVIGNQYVSSDWIVETSKLLDDVSMWGIDEAEIEEDLLTHPVLASVKIEKQWLNTVNIHVVEYERIAYVEEGDTFLPLLETGHTVENFEDTSISPYDDPILIGFENDDVRKELANELTNVSPSIRQRMSEIHLSPIENDPNRLMIYMNDGFVVSSTVNNFAERIEPYPLIVEQLDPDEEGIIHMRMNPYFESFEVEGDEEGESEG